MIKKESAHIKGICIECNKNVQTLRQTIKGVKIYRATCSSCHSKKYRSKFKYKSHKKDTCESCGFKAVHSCQLDVDHIDGNHNNNKLSNLQTLCANCHRLKTITNGDNY